MTGTASWGFSLVYLRTLSKYALVYLWERVLLGSPRPCPPQLLPALNVPDFQAESERCISQQVFFRKQKSDLPGSRDSKKLVRRGEEVA